MRIDELTAAADNLEKERFGSQCRRLMQEYQRQERREEALRIFGGLFEQAAAQRKRAAWLGISSLHTSVQTGKTEYLLAVYGEEFYLDPAPVGRYWTPSVFQECMEEDIRAVIKELRSRFPRIWQYEEAEIYRVCAEYYDAAFCRLCADLADELSKTGTFFQMEKTEHFGIFFGKYQGEGEILWQITGK